MYLCQTLWHIHQSNPQNEATEGHHVCINTVLVVQEWQISSFNFSTNNWYEHTGNIKSKGVAIATPRLCSGAVMPSNSSVYVTVKANVRLSNNTTEALYQRNGKGAKVLEKASQGSLGFEYIHGKLCFHWVFVSVHRHIIIIRFTVLIIPYMQESSGARMLFWN